MRSAPQILSALLLFTSVPAHASPVTAADWSPPRLAPNDLAATPPAPSSSPAAPPAPMTSAPVTVPAAESHPPRAKPNPRVRPAPKPCRKGKAGCRPRRPPKVDPRLLEASSQRAHLLAIAQPMVAAGRHDDAARMLGGAAAAHADPVLYLVAAQAELTGANVSGPRLGRALHFTREAQRLLATPTALRISVAEGPGLAAEAQVLATFVTRRQTQLRRQRRGKAELASGAAFLVLGATGLGMLASGAALTSRIDAARAAYTGQDAVYLADLTNGEQRADTLLAAGMLSGLFGAAIGIPLTVMGTRDLKRARADGAERPTYRLAPGLSGFSISGKF